MSSQCENVMGILPPESNNLIHPQG